MVSFLHRTVEMKISNRTQNFTLRNARTHFKHGSCPKPPMLELHPGSTDISLFEGFFLFGYVAGILVYVAKSFTLAIYFYNPMELGLELSLSKAHRGKLADIYTRMAKGTYSSACLDTKFDHIIVHESKGMAQLSDDPIKVTATMSNARNSTLEVVLEDS